MATSWRGGSSLLMLLPIIVATMVSLGGIAKAVQAFQ